MFYRLLFLLFFCISTTVVYAEIAIIPYKVLNPSKFLPENLGIQYSRLLSIAAIVSKDIEVASSQEVEIDIKRLGGEAALENEILEMYGKSRYLQYILSGKLARVKGRYTVESKLYSVRDKKFVLNINVSSKDFFSLAEKEIGQALINFPNNILLDKKKSLDAVIMLDMSYRVNNEWPSMQTGIVNFFSKIIDQLGIDTKIIFVPYSNNIGFNETAIIKNSLTSIQKVLKRYKPRGKSLPENLQKALEYSLKNTKWRRDADKILLIINNSNMSNARIEGSAIIARKKGVSIFSVNLGSFSETKNEKLNSIARVTGGKSYNAAYHKQVFDANGNPIDLYMENGRFFKSTVYENSWVDGIFETDENISELKKPKRFFEEYFFNSDEINVNPYRMQAMYSKLTSDPIINEKKLENNLSQIFGMISNTYLNKVSHSEFYIGKVLLSDGEISLWSYISDNKFMEYFQQMYKKKHFFSLGIRTKADPGRTYGFSISPFIKGIKQSSLPTRVKTNFSKIITNNNYYSTKGLFYPPIWFIKVKVEMIETIKSY